MSGFDNETVTWGWARNKFLFSQFSSPSHCASGYKNGSMNGIYCYYIGILICIQFSLCYNTDNPFSKKHYSLRISTMIGKNTKKKHFLGTSDAFLPRQLGYNQEKSNFKLFSL